MGGKRAYRPDIDGLRAVAVLLVVAYHAGVPGLSGGYVGVDVFFVISGYLITRLMLDEHASTNRIDLLAFWSRRIRRILPALVTMLVAVALAGTWILLPWEQRDLLEGARSAVLSLANFHFHGMSGGYFSSSIELQPLLHTWSLGVEEQFYFVWPILLSLLLAFGRRTAVVVAPLLIVVSLTASIWSVSSSPTNAFYLPWFRVWELLIGALLALTGLVIRRGRTMAGVIGLGLIVAASILYDTSTRFPGAAALLPTIGAALIIASRPDSVINRTLAIRPMRGIGLVSYSWYLVHWPALVLVRIATQTDSLGRDIAVAIGSLPLAVASWWFVERRFRPTHTPRPRDKRVVVAVGLATIAVITAVTGAVMPRSLSAQSVDPGTTLVGPTPNRILETTERASDSTVVEPEIDWRKRPAQLELSRVVPDLPCSNYELPMPFDPRCRLVEGQSVIVLAGDSHAASIAPVFVDLAQREGWGLALASQPRCPFLPDTEILVCETKYDECTAWNRKVLDDIVRHAADIRAVVVTARSGYYFPGKGIATDTVCQADLSVDGRPATRDEAFRLWRDGLNRLATTLETVGVRLIVVHDVPELERWPSDCLARRSVERCSTGRSELASYAGPARQAERAANTNPPRISYIDPLIALCDDELCPPVRGETILYRDDHHLTPAGSLLLRGVVDAAFTPNS